MSEQQSEKRRRGRPSQGKGVTRANSRVIGIRITHEQERRLKELAAKKHVTPADFLRTLVDMLATDPGAFARGFVAQVHEDLGGPEWSYQKELIDERDLVEAAGQLRLPGAV